MPLGVERELRVGHMIAALVVGDEAFAARCDPSDRPPQGARRIRDDRLLGVMLALVAEAAADVGRDHAHASLRDAELLGDQAAHMVRDLGRDIKRELVASRIANRQHRARFERRADQAVVDEVEPRNVRG